jgi:hypothetical protein
MSNLSDFVLRNTVDTATVFSCCVSTFVNGNLVTFFSNTQNLGDYSEGGHIICKAASNIWIVSPRCAEVSRTWYCRDDANTLANTCTSCTGWFIPTCEQLKNPGYLCRKYWDFFSNFAYWSDTERNATCAWRVEFQESLVREHDIKNCILCVRSFRCVTY